MKKNIFFLLISLKAFSSTPTLDQLSQDDANNVSKEFAVNFLHTTVSGAATLGKIFGFEVGVLAGATTTPKIESISKTYDSSSSVSSLPTVGLMGAVSVPFGITAELNYIPTIGSSGVRFNNFSAGGKFTLTHFLPQSSFDLAGRFFFGSNDLSYSSTVNNSSTGNQDVNAKVTFGNTSFGYNFVLSKKILYIFEPYVGYGEVSTKTKIGVSGSSTVTIFTFSSSQSFESKNSGSMLYGGLNLNLFLLKLGFEYGNIMGVKRYTGKLSLYF